jgi:hypothetical protein
MNAPATETLPSEHEAMIVDCATRMAALFQRLPMLVGFTVQERATLTAERESAPLDEELSVADVSVRAWPGLQGTPELHAEIAAAVLDMLEEHPGARELFRGYTVARAFH